MPPYPTLSSRGSSSTMLTPARIASSTSSPRAIRANASDTAVRGPPFLNSFPFRDDTTTARVGFERTTAAARLAPIPALTNCRREIELDMAHPPATHYRRDGANRDYAT